MVAWVEFESDCGIPKKVHSDQADYLELVAPNMLVELGWKVQCFASLLPTQEKRGTAPGDVDLISYQDKSKTGTCRLGIVDSVEVDQDGLSYLAQSDIG